MSFLLFATSALLGCGDADTRPPAADGGRDSGDRRDGSPEAATPERDGTVDDARDGGAADGSVPDADADADAGPPPIPVCNGIARRLGPPSARLVRASPDGLSLALIEAGVVTLLDVGTMTTRASFLASGTHLRALAWSRDGTRLAAGGDGGALVVIDVDRREVVASFPMPGDVLGLAFSANGSELYVGHRRTYAPVMLNLATGTMSSPEGRHRWPVFSVALSPDGQTLAAGSWDSTTTWRTSDGSFVAATPMAAGMEDRFVAFRPDGAKVFAASGRTIERLDTSTLAVEATATLAANVFDLSVSRMGEVAVSLGSQIVTFAGGALDAPVAFNPASTSAFSLDYLAQEQLVTIAETERELRFWSGIPRVMAGSYAGAIAGVTALDFLDGARLLAAHEDGSTSIVALSAGPSGGPSFGAEVRELAVDEDGSRVLAATADGLVVRAGAAPYAEVYRDAMPRDLTAVTWSSSGDVAIGSGQNNTAEILDGTTFARRRLITGHDDDVVSVSFSRDGLMLASLDASARDAIRFWNVADGAAAGIISLPHGARDGAFDPRGGRYALGDLRGNVELYDVGVWDASTRATGRTGNVNSLAWARSGRYLAAGWDRGTFLVVPVDDAARAAVEVLLPGEPRVVAWSRDGMSVAAGGADGVTWLTCLTAE